MGHSDQATPLVAKYSAPATETGWKPVKYVSALRVRFPKGTLRIAG